MPILPTARHSRADQTRLAQVFGGLRLGEKTFDEGTVPDPLDHLAAHLDAAMRASRAANDIVPHAGPPPERLVQFGRIDAVLPDQLIGDNDGVAVDDLGAAGEAIGTPAERQNVDETPEDSAFLYAAPEWGEHRWVGYCF